MEIYHMYDHTSVDHRLLRLASTAILLLPVTSRNCRLDSASIGHEKHCCFRLRLLFGNKLSRLRVLYLISCGRNQITSGSLSNDRFFRKLAFSALGCK